MYLHFDNSKATLLNMFMNGWPAIGALCFLPLYSLDLASTDFILFGRSDWQLSGRTLDSERRMLETVTDILNEFPKDETKSAFLYWKEICQWGANYTVSNLKSSRDLRWSRSWRPFMPTIVRHTDISAMLLELYLNFRKVSEDGKPILSDDVTCMAENQQSIDFHSVQQILKNR
jgi:hypothetical protein